MNKYAGTKTEQNLKMHLQASHRLVTSTHTLLQLPKRPVTSRSQQFLKTADNEKEHAKMWFKELGGIGNTEENLAAAAAGENYEWTDMYDTMAKRQKQKVSQSLLRSSVV